MEDGDAAQETVDEAYRTLKNAMCALKHRADKTALQIAINMAAPIVEKIELYVPSTVEGLADLLVKAQESYDDPEISQDEVKSIAQELLSAAGRATQKADKSCTDCP